MLSAILPALISAGGSLAGGIIGQNNASSQFWQNVKMSNRVLRKQSKWNKVQLQFAKAMANRNTLRWRMKDAKRSGIHPLYALGANLPANSGPVFQTGGGGPVGYSGDGGFASGIAQAGQFLGRAVDQFATTEQRMEARMLSALNIENAGLQNELLRSQIRRMDAQTGPAFPSSKDTYLIDGQGNTRNITPKEIDNAVMTQKLPGPGQNVKLGKNWQANPYVSNASDVEERHGELADMLWGGVTIPADVYWNLSRSKAGQKIWSLLGYDNFDTRFHFGRR